MYMMYETGGDMTTDITASNGYTRNVIKHWMLDMRNDRLRNLRIFIFTLWFI
jgi:hypothetical protein